MGKHQEFPGSSRGTKLGAVQVNMVDYKFGVGIDSGDLRETKDAVRRLLDSLRTYTTFIPPGKDKTVADVTLVNNQIGEKLSLMLQFGKADDPFLKPFELPLPRQYRERSVKDLHEALKGMGRVDPGGNVPNMVRNITHIMQTPLVPRDMELLLHSTEEPLFLDCFQQLPGQIRERITLVMLDVPARKGLHLPYTSDQDKPGILGIGTPMHSTIRSIGPHFESLSDCNHILTSESLVSLVLNDPKRQQFREFQNPSTAFRAQCALESYNHVLNRGRHIPIITMNDAEMVEYVMSLEKRRAAPTSQDQALSFSSPFDKDHNVSHPTIDSVSSSFQRYFACVTPKPYDSLNFPVSVSCGHRGGYHIACNSKGDRYVIFSSTPSNTGSEKMLSVIGSNDDIAIDKQHVMGAGDAVASILSLTHLWDTEAVVRRYATSSCPLDDRFIETATMIFVSLLSRVAGEVVFHSDRCDWSSIPPDVFPHLIAKTAEKSLQSALHVWGRNGAPQKTQEHEWEIDIALWQL